MFLTKFLAGLENICRMCDIQLYFSLLKHNFENQYQSFHIYLKIKMFICLLRSVPLTIYPIKFNQNMKNEKCNRDLK